MHGSNLTTTRKNEETTGHDEFLLAINQISVKNRWTSHSLDKCVHIKKTLILLSILHTKINPTVYIYITAHANDVYNVTALNT